MENFIQVSWCSFNLASSLIPCMSGARYEAETPNKKWIPGVRIAFHYPPHHQTDLIKKGVVNANYFDLLENKDLTDVPKVALSQVPVLAESPVEQLPPDTPTIYVGRLKPGKVPGAVAGQVIVVVGDAEGTRTLRRAVEVLRAEDPVQGRWLLKNDETDIPVGKPLIDYKSSLQEPLLAQYAFLIGIDHDDRGGDIRVAGPGVCRAVRYGEELIKLLSDPTVVNPPRFERTQAVVLAQPVLPNPEVQHLPPWNPPPCKLSPTSNVILVIIPTTDWDIRTYIADILQPMCDKKELRVVQAWPVDKVGVQAYGAHAGFAIGLDRVNSVRRQLEGDPKVPAITQEVVSLSNEDGYGGILVAAVESFIHEYDTEYNVVVLANAVTGKIRCGVTEGITVDTRFVNRANFFGRVTVGGNKEYANVAVGAIMAARWPELDNKDWRDLATGGASLKALLQRAVRFMDIPW